MIDDRTMSRESGSGMVKQKTTLVATLHTYISYLHLISTSFLLVQLPVHVEQVIVISSPHWSAERA